MTVAEGASKAGQEAPRPGARRALLILLAAAFLVRLPLIPLLGHGYDLYLIKQWALAIGRYGVDDALAWARVDYIGYTYVLWLIDRVHGLFPLPLDLNSPLFHFLVKLPGTLADLGVACLLFVLARRLLAERPELLTPGLQRRLERLPLLGAARLPLIDKGALLVAAFYAFNPAVIYDSAYWGQIDSVIILSMVGALVFLLWGRVGPAWALLTAGALVKPLALVLAPLLALMTLRQGTRAVLAGAAGAALALFVGLGYFLAQGLGPYLWASYERLGREAAEKVSFGAWNLWWPVELFFKTRPAEGFLELGGFSLTYGQFSLLLLAGATLLLVGLFRGRRGAAPLLLAASSLALASFMLPVGVHSRYLLYFLALGAPLALLGQRWLALYLAFSFTAFANVYAVLPTLRAGGLWQFRLSPPISLLTPSISLPLTAANVVLSVLFLALVLKSLRGAGGPSPEGGRQRERSVASSRANEALPSAEP